MKKEPGSKKVKGYVKISTNIPEPLFRRLKDVAATLGSDRTYLIVRALEEKIADFEAEAEAVRRVREKSDAPKSGE